MNESGRIVDTLELAAARPCCEDDGATVTEYAFLLGLIAFVAIAGLSTFGDQVYGLYLAIDGALTLT